MIIGIVGKAGSGKDTAAAMIPDSRRMSFADPLKEFCAQVFGWDRDTLWGASELRNKPDPRYVRANGEILTPRFALQTLGTEWGRACCPDIWALAGVRRAQESGCARAVFSDCRFLNEAQAIRNAGGKIWRVVRPGAGLTGDAAIHPSELEQEQIAADFTLQNTGTLEALRAQVLAALG